MTTALDRKTTSKETKNIIVISFVTSVSIMPGAIETETPPTNAILNRFEPKIFPKTISGFFIFAAAIVPAISGRLVPKATTVTPIIMEDILKYSAKVIALFTTNVLPKIVAVNEAIALNQT